MTVDIWHKLHQRGYFPNHVHYRGLKPDDGTVRGEIQEAVGLYPTDRVLDLGCGYGRVMHSVAPHVCWVTGLDVDDVPLVMANVLLNEAGRFNTGTHRGTGKLLPFQPGTFSLVYSIDTFLHLPREYTRSYAGEIKRVLMPAIGRTYLQFLCDHPSLPREIDPTNVAEQCIGWTLDDLAALFPGAKITTKEHKKVYQVATVVWREHGNLQKRGGPMG